jgi:hypothetical protein
MIIFGSRSSHLESSRLPSATCPNCQEKGTLTASIFSRHVHVFWIPVFPAGRTGIFECKNCHKGFRKKELGEDGKLEYKNFNGHVKTPVWKYSGLGLIAILIGFGSYSAQKDEEKVKTLLENPAMYDVYTLRTDDNYYTTFKVIQVFEDSLYVNYNKYETNKLTGVKDIDKSGNYVDSLYYVFTKKDVSELKASGNLKDITRR